VPGQEQSDADLCTKEGLVCSANHTVGERDGSTLDNVEECVGGVAVHRLKKERVAAWLPHRTPPPKKAAQTQHRLALLTRSVAA